MNSNLPEAFIFMKVGNHAGETFDEILKRKNREHEPAGSIFWGYGGTACHPLELRESEPIEFVAIEKRLLKPGVVPIKVKGKSMEKTILDGAVVGVDTNSKDLAEGYIYCCYLPVFGALIRRVRWRDGGIVLFPDNSEYESKFVVFEEATENLIYGKVVWIFQSMP